MSTRRLPECWPRKCRRGGGLRTCPRSSRCRLPGRSKWRWIGDRPVVLVGPVIPGRGGLWCRRGAVKGWVRDRNGYGIVPDFRRLGSGFRGSRSGLPGCRARLVPASLQADQQADQASSLFGPLGPIRFDPQGSRNLSIRNSRMAVSCSFINDVSRTVRFAREMRKGMIATWALRRGLTRPAPDPQHPRTRFVPGSSVLTLGHDSQPVQVLIGA